MQKPGSLKRMAVVALAGTAMAVLLAATSEQVSARFGGFHGGGGFGGFHGGGFGGARFGDGGLFDRGGDSGFGRGGFGSIRNSANFSDRSNAFRSSHPEFDGDAKQLQQIVSTKRTRCSRTGPMKRTPCNTITKTTGTTGAGTGVAITQVSASAPASRSAPLSPRCPLQQPRCRSPTRNIGTPVVCITRCKTANTSSCRRRTARWSARRRRLVR